MVPVVAEDVKSLHDELADDADVALSVAVHAGRVLSDGAMLDAMETAEVGDDLGDEGGLVVGLEDASRAEVGEDAPELVRDGDGVLVLEGAQEDQTREGVHQEEQERVAFAGGREKSE
jgi:hypothetical protein